MFSGEFQADNASTHNAEVGSSSLPPATRILTILLFFSFRIFLSIRFDKIYDRKKVTILQKILLDDKLLIYDILFPIRKILIYILKIIIMYYFLIVTFLISLFYIFLSNLSVVSFKFNLKYKKYALYFLICFLFGILFVAFISLFTSANYAFLDDLFNPNYWDFGSESNNLKLFLFGFIIAYIILLIKKPYKGID